MKRNFDFFVSFSLIEDRVLIDVGHAEIGSKVSGLVLLKLQIQKKSDRSSNVGGALAHVSCFLEATEINFSTDYEIVNFSFEKNCF